MSYSKLQLFPDHIVELEVSMLDDEGNDFEATIIFKKVVFINFTNIDVDSTSEEGDITEVIDVSISKFKDMDSSSVYFIKKIFPEFYCLTFHSEMDLSIGFLDYSLKTNKNTD
jgi:hypothetical protein